VPNLFVKDIYLNNGFKSILLAKVNTISCDTLSFSAYPQEIVSLLAQSMWC